MKEALRGGDGLDLTRGLELEAWLAARLSAGR